MNDFDLFALPKVGPYVGISKDIVLEFPNGRHFRVLLYGAYNAMGLIGSECNGIAILDEDRLHVLADELAKAQSGYFGPEAFQLGFFDKIVEMGWEEFQTMVNKYKRSRYAI